MISNIKFNSYKRLNNIEIDLKPGINVIAGNNGTCKSTILHVISNSYKKPWSTSEIFLDNSCLNIISSLNKHILPKIETLNKGDQKYNDPTHGNSGTIYSVTFSDDFIQNFRKQNCEGIHRYSIKPNYQKGKKEKLKEAYIIYLSLDRLLPYGEFSDDKSIIKIKKKLPDIYNLMLSKEYSKFTMHDIQNNDTENMGNFKTRSSFTTKDPYVDSNNISSGEDNLLIMMTALYSLIYFCDSLKDDYINTPVYLLIDEFEASLHPEFQIKFLDLFNLFVNEYPNLNLVVTTHSLTTIEECLNKKYNLIYLKKRYDNIIPLTDPDMRKIKANLYTKLYKDLYTPVKIPILTEDKEARVFLSTLFNYFSSKDDRDFNKVKSYFHMVDAQFSSESLKNLFTAPEITNKVFPSICILDGDQNTSKLLSNCITSLPGNKCPEDIIYDTCNYLIRDKSPHTNSYWDSMDEFHGFTPEILSKEIIPEFESMYSKLSQAKESGQSTKGLKRELNKKIFAKYDDLFINIFHFWINQEDNHIQVDLFYTNLKKCFYQVAEYHGLDRSLWSK